MGQKANPVGLRLGINREWDSLWWSEKNLGNWIVEDERVRRIIAKKFKSAEVDRIKIERTPGMLRIIIRTGKPALLIGQKGQEIENLKTQVLAVMKDRQNTKLDIKIEEVKKINLSAQILASNLALQIEKNTPFKRAMKKLMSDAMKDGAKGIKMKVCGRLGGAEMSREEWYAEGRIPTQTLRADIDYAHAQAFTKYGVIGAKVWLFKGEVLGKKALFADRFEKQSDRPEKDYRDRDRAPRKGKRPGSPERGEKEKKDEIVLKKRKSGSASGEKGGE